MGVVNALPLAPPAPLVPALVALPFAFVLPPMRPAGVLVVVELTE